MKKLLSPLLFIFLIGFFVSCSKDEIDQSQDELINVQDTIIGVWEQDGFMEVSGQRLVFAADNSGLKIFRIVYSQDNIVSGLITFNWEINNDIVTVYVDGEDSGVILTYHLNADEQLISEDPSEIPFNKISDTTLDYN